MPAKPDHPLEIAFRIVFGIAFLFALAAGTVYGVEWAYPENELATRLRYTIFEGLQDPDFHFDKHPHDCEFMTAPLGEKHCHYDKTVSTLIVRDGQSGGRVISYDSGKTWSVASKDARSTVFVSWTKVQD